MVSQKQLEGTRVVRKGYPFTQVPSPQSAMVAKRKQCAPWPAITPSRTRSANFYRRIKRRVGHSLRQTHCKRVLVSAIKQASHKLFGTESSFSSVKRVPRPLCRQDSSGGNRQHYSSSLHKQGRRHEVGPIVCPTVENLDLVLPATSDSKSPTHPRPSKCDSGQAIQARSDHPDGVVPPSRSFSKDMQGMAQASNRSVCHDVQPQVTSVCVPSSGPPGCSSRCTLSAMGGSGLPVSKTHSDRPGFAQHALVLGLGGHVQPNSSRPAKSTQSLDTALQSDPSQKSSQSKSPSMAPRATAINEQGFSEAVAARIEAPQRRSTRSVYEAKWAIFTKWCITNQVAFNSPPLKSVADFLLYLFEVKNLQPSTID